MSRDISVATKQQSLSGSESSKAAMLTSKRFYILLTTFLIISILCVFVAYAVPIARSNYESRVADAIIAELPSGIRDRLEGTGFITAFTQSLLMILVTELGDKTFFIAAIMAMKFSRARVLAGALGALIVMTVLSAVLGKAFPLLFNKKWTSAAASVLFLYFGVQLLRDWWKLRKSEGGENEELAEVEEELKADSGTSSSNLGVTVLLSPIFLRAFSLTFFAEWGDRSQIATIALAAAKNIYGVTLGGISGHTICTSLAVLGGRLLATRISERAVALIGGCLFVLFAILTANGKLE